MQVIMRVRQPNPPQPPWHSWSWTHRSCWHHQTLGLDSGRRGSNRRSTKRPCRPTPSSIGPACQPRSAMWAGPTHRHPVWTAQRGIPAPPARERGGRAYVDHHQNPRFQKWYSIPATQNAPAMIWGRAARPIAQAMSSRAWPHLRPLMHPAGADRYTLFPDAFAKVQS